MAEPDRTCAAGETPGVCPTGHTRGSRRPSNLASRWICNRRPPISAKDAVDGAAGHPELPSEAMRSCSKLTAQPADGADDLVAERMLQPLRPTRPVFETIEPLFAIALPPFVDRRAGEVHPPGDL